MSPLPPPQKVPSRLVGLGAFAVSIGLALALPGYGQSPEEHAKHHPKGGDPAMPAAGKDAGKDAGMAGMAGMAGGAGGAGGAGKDAGKDGGGMMGGGMEGMMDGMMKKMGVPPPKDLYPTLMSLPDLTPEQREQVRVQADERMRSGVALLSEALERLAQATENEDHAAMQDATAQVREAVARFETGLAAKRALAEGKPPRQVALQWFKGEMNLQPPHGVEARSGRSGVSLFHLFTMGLLAAFALAMVGMYFVKMRRAAALFGRIEADKGSPPPGSAKPLAGPPADDAKAKPPADDAKVASPVDDAKAAPPAADGKDAPPAADGKDAPAASNGKAAPPAADAKAADGKAGPTAADAKGTET